MTLTNKEAKALAWWLDWSKEDMQRHVDHTKYLSKLGSIPPGCGNTEQKLYDLCVDLLKKIDAV